MALLSSVADVATNPAAAGLSPRVWQVAQDEFQKREHAGLSPAVSATELRQRVRETRPDLQDDDIALKLQNLVALSCLQLSGAGVDEQFTPVPVRVGSPRAAVASCLQPSSSLMRGGTQVAAGVQRPQHPPAAAPCFDDHQRALLEAMLHQRATVNDNRGPRKSDFGSYVHRTYPHLFTAKKRTFVVEVDRAVESGWLRVTGVGGPLAELRVQLVEGPQLAALLSVFPQP
jgi:hypothetical protein